MGLLRFLLAITVVLAHSSSIFGFSFVGGPTAVQAFYIISGFYMALILNEKYVGINNSYKLFISNRFLRIYPIYWLILFLTIVYSVAMAIHSHGKYFGNFNIYADYSRNMSVGSLCFLGFTNLFLFLQDIVMFLGLDLRTGHLFFTANFRETDPMLYRFLFIPQAWTIGVEITFYLIAPFIARKKLEIIILLIMLSLSLRLVLYYQLGLKNDPWTYRFFPTELVFFLLGIVSYHGYKKLCNLEINNIYLKLIWFGIVGFTIFYDFLPIPAKNYLYLIAFFISIPFVFILTKRWKKDSYIGELSYPIYISHMFVLTIISGIKFPIIFGGIGLSLTLMTIVFATILNEWVAKKIEKIRQKRIMTHS
ncbi:acyltransferase family protein [Parasediminibacterium sp. JCM 36343]|uniref:acyltransferase family protein n=1 Tax=Parasediminibacterium sp. JCM 36343 TaxID=3374279 RepID=UPI00397D05C5